MYKYIHRNLLFFLHESKKQIILYNKNFILDDIYEDFGHEI